MDAYCGNIRYSIETPMNLDLVTRWSRMSGEMDAAVPAVKAPPWMKLRENRHTRSVSTAVSEIASKVEEE